MKRLFFLALAVVVMAACSAPSKLINTASYTKINAVQPVVAVLADLEVSPEKITYFMLPSKTVVAGGEKNVIDSAVREALLANGNADVLVGLNTQIKYGSDGQPESITITGYPAKYVNFRSPSDEEILKLKADDSSAPSSPLSLLKK